MMYRLLLSFAFVCGFLPSGAQFRCQVLDADTHLPIAYAVVTDPSGREGQYTDDQGFFTISLPADSLLVRCIGYETWMGKPLEQQPVLALRPLARQLPEASVTAKHVEKILPYAVRKPDYFLGPGGRGIGIELVTRIDFPDGQRQRQLRELRIRMKKKGVDVHCRLHLYEVAADGGPGRELLQDNVVLSADSIHGQECRVDLSAYGVRCEGTALFAGIEWLKSIEEEEEERKPGPRLGISHQVPGAQTYTRTQQHPEWTLLSVMLPGMKYPPALLISLSYN